MLTFRRMSKYTSFLSIGCFKVNTERFLNMPNVKILHDCYSLKKYNIYKGIKRQGSA